MYAVTHPHMRTMTFEQINNRLSAYSLYVLCDQGLAGHLEVWRRVQVAAIENMRPGFAAWLADQ